MHPSTSRAPSSSCCGRRRTSGGAAGWLGVRRRLLRGRPRGCGCMLCCIPYRSRTGGHACLMFGRDGLGTAGRLPREQQSREQHIGWRVGAGGRGEHSSRGRERRPGNASYRIEYIAFIIHRSASRISALARDDSVAAVSRGSVFISIFSKFELELLAPQPPTRSSIACRVVPRSRGSQSRGSPIHVPRSLMRGEPLHSGY